MLNLSLAFLNMWEVLLVLGIVMVFFGAKRIPGLARSLGQSIKEYKSASKEPAVGDQSAARITRKN